VVVLKAAAYLVGKAGAYAKHSLGSPDAEGCLGQWYDGSENFFVHVCKDTN
jgi:hypothetical protein